MTPAQRKAAALALATAIAIPAEGIRRVAYYDPPGILTACRGHTGSDVLVGKIYSLQECDAFMTADMRAAVNTVERCVPGLPSKVLAAFSDAVFNIGPMIACMPNRSTAAKMLRNGDLRGACNQLPRWSNSTIAGILVSLPGLVKRRATEQALCLEGLA